MSLQAILFLVVFVIGTLLALRKGPFYGLLTYIHVYFNIPSHQYWALEVPDLRWSFLSAGILGITILMHKKKITTEPVFSHLSFKLLLAYLVLIFLTSLWAPFPEDAKAGIYEFFRYVVIFGMIAVVITTLRQYEIVIGLITLEMINISLLAHDRFEGGRLDTVGTVDATSANQFAGLLTISLFLLLPLILYGRRWLRLIGLLAAPVIANAFMMCSSRGAFVGMAGGAGPLVISFWKFAKGRWKRWQLFAGLAVAAIIFFRLMDAGFQERLQSIVSMQLDTYEEVSTGRTEIWRAGFEMAREYPLGTGTKGFANISTLYIPEHLIQKDIGYRSSHNTYLLALVEQSLIGLFIFCLFMAYSIKLPFNIRNKLMRLEFDDIQAHDHRQIRSIIMHSICLAAAIISLSVHAIFADRLYFELVYWLGAFSICLTTIARKEAVLYAQLCLKK